MRSTLATLLWGDIAGQRARANLRKELQVLRNAIGDHLRIDRQSVALNPASCWVDLWEIQSISDDGPREERLAALQRAAACYRGDFLAGFQVRNADEFDAWMSAERASLRHAMVRNLESLRALYLEDNEPKRATDVGRQIVRLEPWNEEAHRRLIQSLADSGDASSALAQYDRSKTILRDELDVEPNAATQALAASLRDGTYSSAATDVAINTHSKPKVRFGARKFGTQQPSDTTVDYQLIGRRIEWQQLQTIWEYLAQPHLVCIGGEAGIGKTRLTEELLMKAEQAGQSSARTRCHALEGQLPYSPIVDWLRTPALKPNLALLE